MYALPVNLYVQHQLRTWIQLQLSVLPAAGTVLALFLIIRIGVPGDGNLAWNAKYIAIASFILSISAGYLLGWLLNAVALRMAGWSSLQVSDILLHSRMPTSWLAKRQVERTSASTLILQLEDWGIARQAGPLTFVMRSWYVAAVLAGVLFGLALLSPRFVFTPLSLLDLFLFTLLLTVLSLAPLWCWLQQWYEFHTRRVEAS